MQDQLGGDTGKTSRVAGAPISWGVCEVPSWGHQLATDRVLTDMRSLGLRATEFGPDGFLAAEPGARARQLDSYGLRAVGGFLPIVLHDLSLDPMPEVDRFLDSCLASGAQVMVLAAATGVDGYDVRPAPDELGWETMVHNLDRIADHAAERGIAAALHPHVGTLIETADEVDRLMRGSRVGLCVDTGHLAAGGADPVAVTTAYAGRVSHVHLKDVDMAMAKQVESGDLAFGAAVAAGMFRPLGQGDVDVDALVSTLEAAGYSGWYVLEQDVMLDSASDGSVPIENVRVSLDYLLGVLG